MNQQQQSLMNTAPVRVRATKGFYANVNGAFGVVNPGDVVDLDRGIASTVLNKIEVVAPDTKLVRNTSYLPERKRNPKPDSATQIATLTAAVEALTQTVAMLVTAQRAASAPSAPQTGSDQPTAGSSGKK